MIKCPICNKEINELDEICPNCKTNFNELDGTQYKEEPKENVLNAFVPNEEIQDKRRTNADWLNIMANINIVLSIIGAIVVWINFSTMEVTKKYSYIKGTYTETVANWYGIFGGIAILIVGFTVFFLLKTVVDIYWEVEK